VGRQWKIWPGEDIFLSGALRKKTKPPTNGADKRRAIDDLDGGRNRLSSIGGDQRSRARNDSGDSQSIHFHRRMTGIFYGEPWRGLGHLQRIGKRGIITNGVVLCFFWGGGFGLWGVFFVGGWVLGWGWVLVWGGVGGFWGGGGWFGGVVFVFWFFVFLGCGWGFWLGWCGFWCRGVGLFFWGFVVVRGFGWVGEGLFGGGGGVWTRTPFHQESVVFRNAAPSPREDIDRVPQWGG